MTYSEWIRYQDHMLKHYSGYLGDEDDNYYSDIDIDCECYCGSWL